MSKELSTEPDYKALWQQMCERCDELDKKLAQPQPWEKFCDSNCVWTDHHPDCKLAHPEYDYKDLYEKEKRKSAMWLAKYEEVAGPAPKAYPLAQPEQEPVAFEKTVCPFCTSEWVTAEQHDRNVDRVEQEPVAWMRQDGQRVTTASDRHNYPDYETRYSIPLYTTPPQRKPLTDEEIGAILEGVNAYGTRLYTFARAIEAAHGIKG